MNAKILRIVQKFPELVGFSIGWIVLGPLAGLILRALR